MMHSERSMLFAVTSEDKIAPSMTPIAGIFSAENKAAATPSAIET